MSAACTLVSASSLDKAIEGYGGNIDRRHVLSASWWPSAPRPRASTPSCSTAAAICITAAWQELAEGAREGGLKF